MRVTFSLSNPSLRTSAFRASPMASPSSASTAATSSSNAAARSAWTTRTPYWLSSYRTGTAATDR